MAWRTITNNSNTFTGDDWQWKDFVRYAKENQDGLILCLDFDSYRAEDTYDYLLAEGVNIVALYSLPSYVGVLMYGRVIESIENISCIQGHPAFCFSMENAVGNYIERLGRMGYEYGRDMVDAEDFYIFFHDKMLTSLMRSGTRVNLVGDQALCMSLKNRIEIIDGMEVAYLGKEIQSEEIEEIKEKGALLYYVDLSSDNTKWKEFFEKCIQKKFYISRCWCERVFYTENVMDDDIFSYGREIEQKLRNTMHEDNDLQHRVLFVASQYMMFTRTFLPVIKRFRDADSRCVVLFPSISVMFYSGYTSLKQTLDFIEEVESNGGVCYYATDQANYRSRYDICFLLDEYSEYTAIPQQRIRNMCRFMVALQTTPFYTHMYGWQGIFEWIFGEQRAKIIDYVIVSSFVKDWVNARTNLFQEKLLPMGYPRLDMLYKSLDSEYAIPLEWMEKIQKRPICLISLPVMPMVHRILKLSEKNREIVFICRPHPNFFYDRAEKMSGTQLLKKLGEKDNVIIDTEKDYFAAFQISDALIAYDGESFVLNYIFLRKPILLYASNEFAEAVFHHELISHEQEEWFQAAYHAYDEEDMQQFIDMIKDGQDYLEKEHRKYYEYMSQHFDGKVCDRIFEYFQEKIDEVKG